MVPPIANPAEIEERKASDPLTPSWYGSAYTKLHIWTLTEYSQVFYIDADCLVVGELDHIFGEFESYDFTACPDVFPPDHF
jgi:alpha-N-acetylglucosamine transferase